MVKEVFRRGNREITLSDKQLDWVGGVLTEKALSFGKSKRKSSKWFGKVKLLVSEGSNSWEIFVAINFGSDFIIVPAAGANDRHWKTLVVWFGERRSSGESNVKPTTAEEFRMLAVAAGKEHSTQFLGGCEERGGC